MLRGCERDELATLHGLSPKAKHRGGIVAKAATHVPSCVQEPDADGVAPRHQAIAVMFDFVNPVKAGRRSFGWGWEAGFDKAGGQSRPLPISPDQWRPASRWAWPSRRVLPISCYRIGCTPGRGHRG